MLTRLTTTNRIRLAAGLCASAALLAAACESVPLLAPTQSTIVVSTNRVILPIDGEATISATLVEQSGTPVHNGTLVTFTTTLGVLDPIDGRTKGGTATTRLRSGGQSGTAEVGAISGSAVAEPVMIQIGAAAAAAVFLNATPGTVPAIGGSVNLVAIVTDASGNSLPGVPVSFTASAGSLSATNDITDGNGAAQSTLTTSRQTEVTANAGGQTATATVEVDAAPTATLSVTSTTPTSGQPTIFSVTVNAGSNPVTAVTLDFGDGQSQSLGAATGSTSPSHIYDSPGTYVATLTVVDSEGQSITTSTSVVVLSAGPLDVTLSTSGTLQVNEVVSFTATATPTSGITTIDRYVWNFGDGTTVTTNGNSTSHVYTSSGLKTASVTVTAADDSTGTGVVNINIQPTTPINVNLAASPSPVVEDEAVLFTATVSGSTVPISSYGWDFGDDTSATTAGNTVTKVYSEPETYVIDVTATNTDGDTGSTQTVLVVAPLQVNVNVTVSTLTPKVGQTVTFTATVSPSTVIVTRYDWFFGDGTSTPNGGSTTSHQYAAAAVGDRLVRVDVTLADGSIVSTQILVTVET